MKSTSARLGLLAAVIAVAVVLLVVLQDDGGDDGGGNGTVTAAGTTTTATTTAAPEVLTIKDGQPVGGVKTLTYDKGDEVRIEARLNTPEEAIHVHGYEIENSAEHSPVLFSFPAKLDGIFEIEVHRLDGTSEQIAELRVNP
jgi:FtsP/CotA-like multicopper oxidase with cupredoxin domain